MIMIDYLTHGLAVLLAGLAVAGLVRSPAGRLRRLGDVAPDDASAPDRPVHTTPHGPGRHRRYGWQRSVALPKLAAAFGPRPHAPPLRQRVMIAVAAGIVTTLATRLVLPDPIAAAPVIGLLVGGVVLVVLGRAESRAARRRRERMVQDLPQVLELMAAAMNAGLPLRAAVAEVVAVTDGPLADELADVVRAVDLGQPEAEAWRGLRHHRQLGQISVDLARSVESGTALVAVLRRYAALARRDRRGALEARARTVGVQSVPPLMVCFVPAFLLICVVPTVVSALQHAIG